MKKKILCFFISIIAVITACSMFSACKNNNEVFFGNDGWEGYTGWNGTDGEYDSSAGNIDLPSFDYNGSRLVISAPDCYYEGEAHDEQWEDKHILTYLQNSTIMFAVNSSSATTARLKVTMAVDTENRVIWASDKFTLTVNGQEINLNAEDGNNGEKWLWQPNSNNWWYTDNYVEFDFDIVNLKSEKNNFILSTKSGNIQLENFIIQPI